jgi:glycosyltransferase involved in cell wall biosynthesis
MIRRPHAVWLLDTADPSGAGVMALRRIRALRGHVVGRALAMARGVTRAPARSPFAAVEPATGVGGRLDLAGADIVVTTSSQTLAWASARIRGDQRMVHFVHVDEAAAMRDERFVHNAWRPILVVVPPAVDPLRFARTLGLRHDQVAVQDDFVLGSESLLSTATAPVVLSVGRWTPTGGVPALVEGFALAAPDLPEWQLRLCGWGLSATSIQEFVERRDLHSRVVMMGPRHHIATEYQDAGVVARVAAEDANGLPVLEALAAGVPVLGSPTVPTVARYVQHDVNGLVLDRTDPTAIAEALIELADPARRARLAEGARASRAGLFTDAGARDLADLFRRAMVAEPRRSPLSGGSRV